MVLCFVFRGCEDRVSSLAFLHPRLRRRSPLSAAALEVVLESLARKTLGPQDSVRHDDSRQRRAQNTP